MFTFLPDLLKKNPLLICRLQNELSEKTAQADNLKTELKSLRTQYEEHKRLQEEMERKTSSTHCKIQYTFAQYPQISTQ